MAIKQNNNPIIMKVQAHLFKNSLILLSLFVIRAWQQSLSMTVQSPAIINTDSIYTIQIYEPKLLDYDGIIKLDFPSVDYPSLASVSQVYLSGSPTQTFHFTIAGSSLSITYIRGSNPGMFITFLVDAINNPGSIKTVTVSYTFTNTSQLSSGSGSFGAFSNGPLASCTLTFHDATHTITTATLDITVTNAIDENGTLTIDFPSSWNNPSSSSLYPPITSDSMTCTNVSGSLKSAISCFPLSNSIDVTSIFSAPIPNLGRFSFLMDNVRSPPTNSPSNKITVTTVSGAGNEIDKSTTCSVAVVTPQAMSITTTSTFTVGETQKLDFSWTTNSPLIVGDSIKITLPSNYMSFQSLTSLKISANSQFVFYNTATVTDSQTRTFTITTLTVSEIPAGTVISIANMFVRTLIDTSPRTIQVSIIRNTYQVASDTISITPLANSLSSVSLSSDLRVVSSPMTFTIGFTLKNQLKSDGSLRIIFPASIQYVTGASPSCSVSSSTIPSAMAGSTTCSFDSGLVQLTASNFLSSDIAGGSVLQITITGFLMNPLTTQPTSTFTISTRSSGGHSIDMSADKTYTSISGTIGSLDISRGSTVVGAENMYTFLYTMTRGIKLGSSVTIVIPSQISLSSSPSYKYSINGGTLNSITPTQTTDGDGKKNLQFIGMVIANLNIGSTISIQISNLINPLSMKPSSSFKVMTKHSGYLIQSIQSGKTITNTQLSSFSNLQQAVYNPTNGQQQDYNIYISPKIPLYTNYKIYLDIVDTTSGVNGLAFANPVSGCRIYKGITIIQNTCSIVGNRLTITLTDDLDDVSGATQYQLVVEQVKMARTMAATSNLKLSAYTNDNYGISEQTLTGIQTTIQNKIQVLSLSISTNPSKLNQIQSFTVSFTTFNGLYLLQGDYVVITIPSSYEYVGVASTALICTTSIYTCSFYNGDDHSIKIAPSGSFTSVTIRSTFSVAIASGLYKSPKTFSYNTDYFYVTTYTSTDTLIDSTVPQDPDTTASATFYRTCGGFCETCLTSNTQHCLTCYAVDGLITYDGYNYLTSDNLCLDDCGANYYNDSGVCTRCSEPCYECDLHQLDCTSCVSGYFFDPSETAQNASCKLSCPQGYFEDSSANLCKLCNAQCAECAVSSILCTACRSGRYLYNSECRTTCPSGYYEDGTENQCVQCDISCNGCDTSTTDCIQCANNYYLSGVNCVTDCPSGTVKNSNTGICECQGQCLTCQVQLTRCTSCIDTNKVLYENTCLSDCPSGSYLPTGQSECTDCPFSHCTKCTEAACLICTTGYFLHLGGCVLNCPSSYYQSGNLCADCGDGCASCEDQIQCLTCSSPYLKQLTQCVSACSSDFVNFNATSCVDVCPIGYSQVSGKCQENQDQSVTPATGTVVQQTTTAKVIPFPYTIAFCLMAAVCIAMKCIHSYTLLPSAIMAIGSILQILSAVTFIIASIVELQKLKTSVMVVLVVLIINFICNILCMVFVIKVLNNDKKFLPIYKKTVCSNIVIRAITVSVSHKFHQIVFSNIFGAKALCNKVEYVGKLLPFNILLMVSILSTIVCIIGTGITSYSVQQLRMSSPTFIWSVDCIVVWVLNLIATILVLRRKGDDYEKFPDDDQAKRYETQDQFNFNNQSCGVDDVFMEESRVNYARQSKNGQSRKNYFYQNSSKSIGGEDPYETPLNRKKLNNKNPITTGKDDEVEESSEALCIGDKNKNKKRIQEDSNEDIQEIMLEEPVRDNLININKAGQLQSPNKNDPKNPKLNYEGYDLDPHLLEMPQNSEQFKKLPAQTKSKIRLAKANMQINNNSKKLKSGRNGEQNNEQDQLDEIQLSPKKNEKNKNKKDNSESGMSPRSQNKSNMKGLSKSKSKQKNRSSSNPKSKSLQKNLVKTKPKGSALSPRNKNLGNSQNENEGDIGIDLIAIEQQPSERVKRNRSEQMKKKDLVNTNKESTKSQNIKKKGRKNNKSGDINVTYVNAKQGDKQFVRNGKRVNNSSDDGLEQQEPSLPVFKHAKKGQNYGSDSDGIDFGEQSNNLEEGKRKRKYDKSRRSERNLNRDKETKNRLQGKNGDNNQMTQQDRDQIPQLHSSEQLGSLIINRNQSTNKKSDGVAFENDDESIYNKIYKDQTETLKSVQGDNFFGQDISPSQFNLQNQRFEETEIGSNDMPVKPFITHQFDEDGNIQLTKNDGFDDVPEIRRYGSSKNNFNIDYDLVREKRQDNDRIKQLEKIYLPRLEVRGPPARKKK